MFFLILINQYFINLGDHAKYTYIRKSYIAMAFIGPLHHMMNIQPDFSTSPMVKGTFYPAGYGENSGYLSTVREKPLVSLVTTYQSS